MKERFRGSKNSVQLKSSWTMLASEVSRLSDITVKSTQCKSKIKYMQKQYTEYRVAQSDTGNRTDAPLREPPCYATMCDVWGDASGMQTDAFYSSDERRRRADYGSQQGSELVEAGALSDQVADEKTHWNWRRQRKDKQVPIKGRVGVARDPQSAASL
ncbi:hypothetical protein V7S43_002560 [Phytophthora oleae]|uniref:Myb/SANT-like domain-containing protein n=1 Tax=Phytophthora oleae TaxID=2107226 RepID=A0ABD3FYM7_9STRA